jgi:predicted acetyltransferase
MSTTLRWAREDELDIVALTRLRCYAKAGAELARFKESIRKDPRAKAGDFLLAEVDGQAVGTATHMSFDMFVRGGKIPCQGVAWVGAIKTMRRRGEGRTPGIASAVMHEMLRHARDRGDVVSALMPFRASYYEHFGYGVVERRVDWTVPISALPIGPFDGVRFYEPGDFGARADCLRRIAAAGQCDLARSDDYWKLLDQSADDGLAIIDRLGDGAARGGMLLMHQQVNGKDVMHASGLFYEDPAALRRQLCFLASLKDQFSAAVLTLPADVPLNRLLKESQIPHRPVNHAVAEPKMYTRMQMRILDHARFLQSLHVPIKSSGKMVVAVHECEGHVSKFEVDFNSGRAVCRPTDRSAEFECPDRVWAAVACGDIKATDAIQWGLASGKGDFLDLLAMGSVPFCHEYF